MSPHSDAVGRDPKYGREQRVRIEKIGGKFEIIAKA